MTSAGEIIGGRYELRKEMASHGLARVFEAHDRVRGCAVRVKYLAIQGEHGRALLMHESRLLVMLAGQTSGTLAFHDLIEHEGVLYQVTEHVHGVWLRGWQEQKPSSRQIARVYAHLAQVLQEMHVAGVVHRDITPASVMVVEDDYPGRHSAWHPARIKITELEVAVRTTELDTINAAGQLIGTLPYRARRCFCTRARPRRATCSLWAACSSKRSRENDHGSSPVGKAWSDSPCHRICMASPAVRSANW